MVRLEKQIYEQICNQHLLKRGRTITVPSKWYTENRTDAFYAAGQKVALSGITGRIFRALEGTFTKYTYKWYQDIAYQRGFALEDFFLHQDRELRRCYIWEKFARESLHPYQWVFQVKRRARYYKIERGLRGFYVPDYIKKEGEERLFADTVENKQTWEDFVYTQYMADQTPNFRWSALGKKTILELFIPYGLWRGEAWDRYFLNEKFYEEWSPEQIQESIDKVFPQDISTANGKAEFEAEVNRFVELYPNSVCPAGQQYNFAKYYAKKALLDGADTSSHDQNLINELKNELLEKEQGLIEGDAPPTGSGKSIGSILPEFVRPKAGAAYFAK